MPDSRKVECAAERWAIQELRAIRTRRALRTKWARVDFFGADVLAFTANLEFVLVQATKVSGGPKTKRRRKLERLGGDLDVPVEEAWIDPQPGERRILLDWQSRRHPDDGRRTIHEFVVQELVDVLDAEAREDLHHDGKSREPVPGWVWATYEEPFQIPDKDEWYTAPDPPGGGDG